MTEPNDLKPIEPGQTWEVDRFRPEDAPGATGLFRLVYGEGYPIRTFIDPAALIEENRAQRTISSVARTPSGDIVGHNAIFQSAPSPRVYESGAGVVHPDYRGGHGIFGRMFDHGIELAKAMNLGVVFGEPVCNHVFSQKMCRRHGLITMAAEIDLMPAEAYAAEQSAQGRVSTTLGFMTTQANPHRVFLPDPYGEQLTRVYRNLDDERELVPADDAPAEGETDIDGRYFDFAQAARLAVRRLGADFDTALTAVEADLADKGAQVIQVWLDLTQPGLNRAVEMLRAKGYFFGGALPQWFGPDGLLMQWRGGRPNWEGIVLAFDDDRELIDLIRADWQTVTGGDENG